LAILPSADCPRASSSEEKKVLNAVTTSLSAIVPNTTSNLRYDRGQEPIVRQT
jgi:hypothetical protein